MQATLRLVGVSPAPLSGVSVGSVHRLGAGHAPETGIALVVLRVVGKIVLKKVLPDLFLCPVGKWIDLKHAVLRLPRQDVRVGPALGLVAAHAGDPGAAVCEEVLQRLYLPQEAAAVRVSVPELVALLLRLLVEREPPVHPSHVHVELLVEVVAQLVGLRKEQVRVEVKDGGAGPQIGQHVHNDDARGAEAGALRQVVAKGVNGPVQDGFGAVRLELGVEGRDACARPGRGGAIGSIIHRSGRNRYREWSGRGGRASLGDLGLTLKKAIENVDVVFHAAALKHVPLCEYNPFEGVKTNVTGTQNLIDVALDEEVERFITISTDKVVNPINVMGATKLLAERLTTSADLYKGDRETVFSVVRFGNVLNSRGSLLPLIRKQVNSGGPVTLTHTDMTRFVMSIHEATELVMEAAVKAKGGEIFILKMPAVRIKELIEVIVDELGPKYGYSPGEIEIKDIGIRAGEKLYEELMTVEETVHAKKIDNMYVVFSRESFDKEVENNFSYRSDRTKLLDKGEMKDLLRKIKYF